jgi:hypothetical protein
LPVPATQPIEKQPSEEQPTELDSPGSLDLGLCGHPLAQYVWRPDLPPSLAPRPYLHPVRTLAGTPVTELMPASHPHHLGVSIAVPELDGGNYWGGRTFLAGHGPAWLDNHGVQRHHRWVRRSATRAEHRLQWVDHNEVTLLHEHRVISCRPVSATAWALGFAFALTNVAGRPLTLNSPAAHGRAGAGYGGFFWRVAGSGHRVRMFGPPGDGVAALHGATAGWIALAGTSAADAPEWTLVFTAADHRTEGDPWFLRTRDYLGVGSALAWDKSLTVEPEVSVERSIVTVIADGMLSRAETVDLADAVRSWT